MYNTEYISKLRIVSCLTNKFSAHGIAIVADYSYSVKTHFFSEQLETDSMNLLLSVDCTNPHLNLASVFMEVPILLLHKP